MRITEVNAVYPKWTQIPSGYWQSYFWQIVVRVETDGGVTGLGYGGGGAPGCAVINQHLRELLVGRTIESIEDIRDTWDLLYSRSLPYGRKGIPVMAISGVDLALWDLLGKARGVPVYELLGGIRKPRVRAYASGMEMERYRDMGYTANKFDPGRDNTDEALRQTVAAATRSREVFGAEGMIMTDCYMGWDAEMTRRTAEAVDGLDLYWFEDVLTPDLLAEQAELREQIRPIQLAGGEHEFTRFGFVAIANAGALDIWQPDITWCGGITEGLRILDLAGQHGVRVVPHRGGKIWGLHFIAASDCDDLAETHPKRWVPPRDELWLDEPQTVDGLLTPPDRPGFGVGLNEAML